MPSIFDHPQVQPIMDALEQEKLILSQLPWYAWMKKGKSNAKIRNLELNLARQLRIAKAEEDAG